MSKIAGEPSAAAAAGHETTHEPFSKSMKSLLQNVSTLISDNLKDSELGRYSQITRSFSIACRKNLADRKCVREELLPHVFGANPKGIEEFFTTASVFRHPKILLTKASYREGYQSKKLNDFVCFREWEGVSPLQTAYLCGDGPFLGRKLLAYIINNTPSTDIERLLAEARQQLQELLNRVVKVKVEEEASAATAASAAAAAAFAAAGAASVTAAAASTKQEKESADSAEFLSPIKKLSKAYQTYISRYDSLFSQNQYAELDRLWGEVGECHRRLPRYILQEFFGSTPFYPVPEFNIEPARDACHYWNNTLLDLDDLGISNFLGLYKGADERAASGEVGGRRAVWRAELDLAAISRLCELRDVDLRNTINCLQSFETALTLINHGQTVRVAC